MDTKEITADVKNEVQKTMEKLATLRDEAKLHLHLATLDAKQEWDDKLEPKIAELQTSAAQLTETSRTAVQELVTRVESFVDRLRGQGAPPASKPS
jgi:hypothetical protein